MKYIDKISDAAYQQLFLTGNAGQRITLTLIYMPTQEAWFMNISDETGFELNGVRVVNSPNILRKYRNNIDFGINCVTASGLDPYFIDDFNNQNAFLYLMDADDIAETEEFYYS